MKVVRELSYTVRAWLWTLFWIAVCDEIILNGRLTNAVHTALVGTVMILGSVTLAAIVTCNVTITVSSDEEKEDK